MPESKLALPLTSFPLMDPMSLPLSSPVASFSMVDRRRPVTEDLHFSQNDEEDEILYGWYSPQQHSKTNRVWTMLDKNGQRVPVTQVDSDPKYKPAWKDAVSRGPVKNASGGFTWQQHHKYRRPIFR